MASEKMNVATTRRAYTFRLSGVNRDDHSWREYLWKTHEAVNRGAKVFGDWLLTLRGGLDHRLADAELKEGEKPTRDEVKHRRILLALSWLSVESKVGSPQDYRVKQGGVLEAFRDILRKRGLSQALVNEWEEDCRDSLQAPIREDAVWVNRSDAFDELSCRYGRECDRSVAAYMVDSFFEGMEAFFLPSDAGNLSQKGDTSYAIKAGNWLSRNWGTGKKSDTAHILLSLERVHHADLRGYVDKPARELLQAVCNTLGIEAEGSDYVRRIKENIGWKGRPGSVEMAFSSISSDLDAIVTVDQIDALKIKLEKEIRTQRKKCGEAIPAWMTTCQSELEGQLGIAYVTGRNLTWEFAVMLDHALRRVSQTHSWIKLAEAERRQYDSEVNKIRVVPPVVVGWLDAFCANRADEMNAVDGYVIRPRAVQGWQEVVKAWSRPECQTAEDRVRAVRQVQGDLDEDAKFGEAELFERLAVEEATCVWRKDGKTCADLLQHYVEARWAEFRRRAFKVPAYRHPDELKHPVFCDFGDSRWGIRYDIQKKQSGHGMVMGLWTGECVENRLFLWHSKRLCRDLGIRYLQKTTQSTVSRADRLGRSVVGAKDDTPVRVAGVFEKKKWNGRLQIPRAQLNEMARVREHEKYSVEEKARRLSKLKNSLKWFVTLSVDLQPIGPWPAYRQAHSAVWRTISEENRNRKAYSKLGLCRLPHLRVLSVDLGHRFAAACAIWETISQDDFDAVCKQAQQHGFTVRREKLHAAICEPGKTTVFRRTGKEMWARLERQFLIKLPGEDRDARKASEDEEKIVERIYRAVGLLAGDTAAGPSIQDLLETALRDVRINLRRHASVARIARNWIAQEKPGTGGTVQALTPETRIELLVDTLQEWRALFTSSRAVDDWAQREWEKVFGSAVCEELKSCDPQQRDSYRRREEKSQRLRALLRPLAEQLTDAALIRLHECWQRHWLDMDEVWRTVLKTLRTAILPRGERNTAGIRRKGGLSLRRIGLIRTLYQVHKAYFSRLRADSPSEKPKERYGQRILNAMERLRENRVKQLASRIVEAALGVGREPAKMLRRGLVKTPPRRQVSECRPCHVVVVENLENYRPDQVRLRAENRRLMDWAARSVRKYLLDACQLHGLYVWEVLANYTSRQDSRTGKSGVRCRDIPVKAFLDESHWIHPKIISAKERLAKGKATVRDRYLVECFDRLVGLTESEQKRVSAVRIPWKGGDLFVSADSDSPAAQGLQADLNAAANIGLRALVDPDWEGRWWYVPCDPKTYRPKSEKLAGCTVIDIRQQLSVESSSATTQPRDTVYFWRDVSTHPIHSTQWRCLADYWHSVDERVCATLRTQMEKRIRAAREATPF